MDAVEYFKERTRLTKSCEIGCKECRLSSYNNGKEMSCDSIERCFPELAVEIIEKWSSEHPKKTRQSEFIKIFPDACVIDEILRVCPAKVDVNCISKAECIRTKCPDCCKTYWHAEVE